MGRKANTYAEWRLMESISQYNFYAKMYKRLLISYFNWKFPSELKVSVPFLERTLFENGFAIFYNDKGIWRIAKASPQGLNDYDEPVGFSVESNFKNMESYVKADDCVIIKNDKLCNPSFEAVNFFAKKLERIEKTIDVNMEHLKKPYIITCPEGQLNSVRSVMQKKADGEIEIYETSAFDQFNKVEVLDFHVKNEVPSLYEIKREIINESLTYFGINNVDFEKKERLVRGEVEQNNERILINQNILLEPRQTACDEIKKKFGIDVEVEVCFNELKRNSELLKGGVCLGKSYDNRIPTGTK